MVEINETHVMPLCIACKKFDRSCAESSGFIGTNAQSSTTSTESSDSWPNLSSNHADSSVRTPM
jgi:hypothetical protein